MRTSVRTSRMQSPTTSSASCASAASNYSSYSTDSRASVRREGASSYYRILSTQPTPGQNHRVIIYDMKGGIKAIVDTSDTPASSNIAEDDLPENGIALDEYLARCFPKDGLVNQDYAEEVLSHVPEGKIHRLSQTPPLSPSMQTLDSTYQGTPLHQTTSVSMQHQPREATSQHRAGYAISSYPSNPHANRHVQQRFFESDFNSQSAGRHYQEQISSLQRVFDYSSQYAYQAHTVERTRMDESVQLRTRLKLPAGVEENEC